MGTGAVYVTLSGLKQHPRTLTTVETILFFLNLSLFLLNSSTLLLQVLCGCNQFVLCAVSVVLLWTWSSVSATVQATNQ